MEEIGLLNSLEKTGRILSCSRATLYRLIERGQLRAVKNGRSTRITGDSIRTYVASLREFASKNAA